MKQMVLVFLMGLLIVAIAYGVNRAYEQYTELKRLEMYGSQISDGVKLAQAGNYREALGRFVAVYQRAPNETMRAVAGRNAAVCLVHLGDEAMQLGNVSLATEYYLHALHYDPNSSAARERLERVQRQISANSLPTAPLSPPSAAANAIPPTAGMSGRPSNNERLAEELYLRGLEAYQRGDPFTAVDLWQRAIEAAPNSETAKLAMRLIRHLTVR